MIGRTLSHYRITAAIGAGGMGEVYRATDTALGRDVAIKVLPSELAQDAERLGRFRREAQLLASLNHPHIAAIYGLEEAEGQPFLALELVEGEDLKQRLSRGAIPMAEAIEIAIGIASALEEAHNKGIVHRDLKPANVKLTPDGKVKVLDFGLAKAYAGDSGIGSSGDLSQSPTLGLTGTRAGVILGTAAYMAPEQARGKPVDRRADIWAFGVLLWEMLTGRAMFSGDTVTDVIAAVVTREPDLDALPAATPRAVRQLIGRCLRKDPRNRLPDMGAARLELQEALAGGADEARSAVPDSGDATRAAQKGRARERWAWATLAVVLAGLASILALRMPRAAPELRPPVRFAIEMPDRMGFWNWNPIAMSPDGRHVVVTASTAGHDTELWVRSLDSPGVRPLPGTKGALGGHFWSPDSTAIAFLADKELRKLTLASGTVQRICSLPGDGFSSGTWSTDGTIVIADSWPRSRLYSVPESGGELRPLLTLDKARGETAHGWPQFLPDGRHLLVTIAAAKAEHAGLYAVPLGQPAERRRIRPEVVRFQFARPGYVLFTPDTTLLAQRLDPETLATTGEPVPIATSVARFESIPGWAWFSASDTGRVAWLPGLTDVLQLDWIDRKGQRIGALGEPGRYSQLALSPDGRRVVVEAAGDNDRYDLWVFDVARGVPSRLTTEANNERDPVWSPDSLEIIYSSDAGGDQNLLRKGLQGSAAAAPLPNGIGQTAGARDIAENWVRGENTLIYMTLGDEQAFWAVSLDGGGAPAALMKSRFQVDEPQVSPDGRLLAYISDESGSREVYVEPFRRRGERVRVSTNGGGQPKWRGDGRELFYLSLDGGLISVDVRDGTTGPEVSAPRVLVPADELRAVVQGPDYDDYAVTADGQRFLVKRRAEAGGQQQPHVLLDWPSLVK